jgi:hypothetical protein
MMPAGFITSLLPVSPENLLKSRIGEKLQKNSFAYLGGIAKFLRVVSAIQGRSGL